jgi:uncharacterized protein (DUF849 family)
MANLTEHIEQMAAAYLKKTNLSPDDVVLVQSINQDGVVAYWIERKNIRNALNSNLDAQDNLIKVLARMNVLAKGLGIDLPLREELEKAVIDLSLSQSKLIEAVLQK